jgi:predicted permease
MPEYYLKLLEIFFIPLLILGSVVGLTVWFKQQKDRGIVVLLFVLTCLISFGISVEYKKLTAQELKMSTTKVHMVVKDDMLK